MPQLASIASPRTGVKALAGMGMAAAVAATLTLPVEAAPALLASGGSSAQASPTPDPVVSAARVVEVEAGSASRSQGRTSIAVQAPHAAAPQASTTFGVSGVTAVAKPKPTPVAGGADQSTEGGSSSSSSSSTSGNGSSQGSSTSSSGNYSTGAYSSAGRALGLGPTAQRLYSAIRSQFGISNIGGYRPGDSGDHGSGRAVDVMTSGAQGDAVAAFVQAHAGEFNVKYVIWKQRIWFPGRSGWRHMADRGSATANHYDHVHISVN